MVLHRMPRFLLIALLVALAPGWAAAQVRYEAEIVGIEDKAVRKDADEVAQLKQLEDKPAATLAALRRRA